MKLGIKKEKGDLAEKVTLKLGFRKVVIHSLTLTSPQLSEDGAGGSPYPPRCHHEHPSSGCLQRSNKAGGSGRLSHPCTKPENSTSSQDRRFPSV